MSTVAHTVTAAPTSPTGPRATDLAALLALFAELGAVETLEALENPGCPLVPALAVPPAGDYPDRCGRCPDPDDARDATATVCRRDTPDGHVHRYDVCPGCVRAELREQLRLPAHLYPRRPGADHAVWVEIPTAAARPPAPVIPITRGAR